VVAFAHEFKSARAPSGEKPQYPGFCDKVICTDHLGSVREMTDATGAVRARYDFDPYGRITKLSGDLEADFGFTGFYRHQSSGLNLTFYRAYDANLGRWLSRDPIEDAELTQGPNLYIYVLNGPINDVDYLGLANVGRTGTGVATRGWLEHKSYLTFTVSCPIGQKVSKVVVHYKPLAGALGSSVDPSSSNPRAIEGANCDGKPVFVQTHMRTRYAGYLLGSLTNVQAYIDFTWISYECEKCCN